MYAYEQLRSKAVCYKYSYRVTIMIASDSSKACCEGVKIDK